MANRIHRVEANGSNAARARAELQRKLRLAAEMERRSRDEVDRLSALAHELGWSDGEIAQTLDLDYGTVAYRRKRGFKRGPVGRPRKSHLDQVAPRL